MPPSGLCFQFGACTGFMNDHPYTDLDLCRKDLIMARELFGTRTTTRKQYESMLRSLALMLLHCPEDFTVHVESTLYEANTRQMMFFDQHWAKQEASDASSA